MEPIFWQTTYQSSFQPLKLSTTPQSPSKPATQASQKANELMAKRSRQNEWQTTYRENFKKHEGQRRPYSSSGSMKSDKILPHSQFNRTASLDSAQKQGIKKGTFQNRISLLEQIRLFEKEVRSELNNRKRHEIRLKSANDKKEPIAIERARSRLETTEKKLQEALLTLESFRQEHQENLPPYKPAIFEEI